MKVEPGSVWLYVGPNPGKNIPHCVTSIEKHPAKDIPEVTTWSAFDSNPANGGFAWMGSEKDFLKNFQPLQPV